MFQKRIEFDEKTKYAKMYKWFFVILEKFKGCLPRHIDSLLNIFLGTYMYSFWLNSQWETTMWYNFKSWLNEMNRLLRTVLPLANKPDRYNLLFMWCTAPNFYSLPDIASMVSCTVCSTVLTDQSKGYITDRIQFSKITIL